MSSSLPSILPVAYLPPVSHFTAMLSHSETFWDVCEHYHKQFYYNRCMIYGPNGAQKLVIPIHKRYERTPLKDIVVSYETDWQKIHWRSFEAAYRRSPYFEYYESELSPLYFEYKPQSLVEWNHKLLDAICRLLDVKISLSFTKEYVKDQSNKDDYRHLANPQEIVSAKEIKYHQVFEERHGFLSNLSIIDLLFCEGPHAKELLLS